jgi:hypothetical protein
MEINQPSNNFIDPKIPSDKPVIDSVISTDEATYNLQNHSIISELPQNQLTEDQSAHVNDVETAKDAESLPHAIDDSKSLSQIDQATVTNTKLGEYTSLNKAQLIGRVALNLAILPVEIFVTTLSVGATLGAAAAIGGIPLVPAVIICDQLRNIGLAIPGLSTGAEASLLLASTSALVSFYVSGWFNQDNSRNPFNTDSAVQSSIWAELKDEALRAAVVIPLLGTFTGTAMTTFPWHLT